MRRRQVKRSRKLGRKKPKSTPPAGFERFFAEVVEEWAQPERDISRITAISEKYGIHSA